MQETTHKNLFESLGAMIVQLWYTFQLNRRNACAKDAVCSTKMIITFDSLKTNQKAIKNIFFSNEGTETTYDWVTITF